RFSRDWSSDVCSSDLYPIIISIAIARIQSRCWDPCCPTCSEMQTVRNAYTRVDSNWNFSVTLDFKPCMLDGCTTSKPTVNFTTRSEERRVGKESASPA